MFFLSAFADEISTDPAQQMDVLTQCGVRHIELRSIHGTNVLLLSDAQVLAFKADLQQRGFRLSAIGSPIGKIRIDEPFAPHLEKFQRAIHLCRVFETPNIRIFSFYPPAEFSGDWAPHRAEVFHRLGQLVEIARKEGVTLFHENEHRIYGDSPERILDLHRQFDGPNFKAAFDPANFVYCGYDPMAGWLASQRYTAHLHIKDWKKGADHGSLAGEGDGRISEIINDVVKRGYSGFATLEPHLLGGGPTGGHTGPELFPKAVAAFKSILDKAGATYA